MNPSVLTANLVIIYKTLDTAKVSLDKLKSEFEGQVPRFFGFDAVAISQFEELKSELILTIPDRRLEVRSLDIPGTGFSSLAKLTHHAVASISEAQVAAYGVNFVSRLDAGSQENARNLVRQKFFNEKFTEEIKFRGSLIAGLPTLIFEDGHRRDQFAFGIDIPDGKTINSTLNIHFDNATPPAAAELEQSLNNDAQYFIQTIQELFKST